MNPNRNPLGVNRVPVPTSNIKASSSIGRAAVSKTAGWGFDSLLACQRSNAGGNVVVRIANPFGGRLAVTGSE